MNNHVEKRAQCSNARGVEGEGRGPSVRSFRGARATLRQPPPPPHTRPPLLGGERGKARLAPMTRAPRAARARAPRGCVRIRGRVAGALALALALALGGAGAATGGGHPGGEGVAGGAPLPWLSPDATGGDGVEGGGDSSGAAARNCANAMKVGKPACLHGGTLFSTDSSSSSENCASCKCPAGGGWRGPDCSVCVDASACPESPDGTAATNCTSDTLLPTEEELASEGGKRLSCVCGGFRAMETVCVSPDSLQPATSFLMAYANATDADDGTHVLRVEEYGGTPVQVIPEIPPERYDYAYPGVMDANFTGCSLSVTECASPLWHGGGESTPPESCITIHCVGGQVQCPPADVPKCPGYNIFGCGDCTDCTPAKSPSGKTYKYWQHHCNPLSTPQSNVPSTLECEANPSTEDGAFRCVFSQFTSLGMTCHVGGCLYQDAPPVPVPPAPPADKHKSAVDAAVLYGFGAAVAALTGAGFLLAPLSTRWHDALQAKHQQEGEGARSQSFTLVPNNDTTLATAGLQTTRLFASMLALSWHDVSYTPEGSSWEAPSCVLHDVSGVAAHSCAESTGLCAILGPSGAGKSTLLDVLSGRLSGRCVRGTVRVNGQIASAEALRSISGYVPQEDALPSTSTVLEHLLFHAALRLPRQMGREQRERRVCELVTRLGLQKVAGGTIGSASRRGLSGGERRRVSIAAELLTQPGLLFLDEPTSGLDSSNSTRVLGILSALGEGGVTSVMSIHQPRADAFQLFDRVLILSGDGRMVYSGSARDVRAHFEAVGPAYAPREHEHVADRVLDALVRGSANDAEELVRAGVAMRGALRDDFTTLCCAPEVFPCTVDTSASEADRVPPQRASWLRRLLLLCWRDTVDCIRDPFHIYLTYGATAVTAGALGLLYRDAGTETAGMQDRLGAFFFVLVYMSLLTMGSVPSWHENRLIFLHERALGVYGTLEYVLGGLAVDVLLLRVLPAWFFVGFTYRTVGFNDADGHQAAFALILLASNTAAAILCMAVTCSSRSPRAANLIMSNVFIIVFMFGGFLLNKHSLPELVRWLSYLSFVNYAFELLAANEFHDTPAKWTFVVPNTTDPGDKPLPPLTVDGDSVLSQFGLDASNASLDVCLLLAVCAVGGIVAYTKLRLLNTQSRSSNGLMSDTWARLMSIRNDGRSSREDVDRHLLGEHGGNSSDFLLDECEGIRSDDPRAGDEAAEHSVDVPPRRDRSALSLTWREVGVVDVTTKGDTPILRDVSGVAAHSCAESTGLCAILGPSGAGKSTLLDVLSGRLSGRCVRGTVRVNGQIASAEALRSISGYVPQEDALPSTSTVLEHLLFHAALRLPRQMGREQRERRVCELVTRLGLQKVAGGTIGSASRRGLSGGERRRVSIAAELLTQPGLLFLDEPTSGLDSSNSTRVLGILSALGEGGVTSVMSIHQPRADAFQLFDRVLILSGDGRMVYSGSARDVRAHFEAVGPAYAPREHEHVADRVLDALVHGEPATVDELVRHATHTFQRSVEGAVRSRVGTGGVPPGGCGSAFARRRHRFAPFGLQLRLLLWRAFYNTLRHPLLLTVNFLVSFLMATVIGVTFERAGIDSPGIQNRLGCIFFVALYFALMSLSSLPLWHEERRLFIHERAGGSYGTLAYFLSSVLVDTLVLRLVPPCFFALSAHFLVDLLPSGRRVAVFTIVVALLNTAASACSMMIGAAASSPAVANVAGALWILASVLFGGLVLSQEEGDAPAIVRVLGHCSYFRYGYEALLINEFHGTQGWHFSSYKGARLARTLPRGHLARAVRGQGARASSSGATSRPAQRADRRAPRRPCTRFQLLRSFTRS